MFLRLCFIFLIASNLKASSAYDRISCELSNLSTEFTTEEFDWSIRSEENLKTFKDSVDSFIKENKEATYLPKGLLRLWHLRLTKIETLYEKFYKNTVLKLQWNKIIETIEALHSHRSEETVLALKDKINRLYSSFMQMKFETERQKVENIFEENLIKDFYILSKDFSLTFKKAQNQTHFILPIAK